MGYKEIIVIRKRSFHTSNRWTRESHEHVFTLMIATPFCSYYHSVQFKGSLSKPFRIQVYRIAKQLSVSIQYLDHRETCIKMQS
jgi:hypothetical protein